MSPWSYCQHRYPLALSLSLSPCSVTTATPLLSSSLCYVTIILLCQHRHPLALSSSLGYVTLILLCQHCHPLALSLSLPPCSVITATPLLSPLCHVSIVIPLFCHHHCPCSTWIKIGLDWKCRFFHLTLVAQSSFIIAACFPWPSSCHQLDVSVKHCTSLYTIGLWSYNGTRELGIMWSTINVMSQQRIAIQQDPRIIMIHVAIHKSRNRRV